MKHTQGEWKVDDSVEYQLSVISPWSKENPVESSAVFGDYRGGIICQMWWNTGVPMKEQALANAKLIAAAPKMKRKLEAIIARLNGEWDHPALLEQGLLSDSDTDILNYATEALKATE